jgi:hypothetical protein
LAVSVVTIGKLRAGVLAATDVVTRDRRLDTLTTALSSRRSVSAWARMGKTVSPCVS